MNFVCGKSNNIVAFHALIHSHLSAYTSFDIVYQLMIDKSSMFKILVDKVYMKEFRKPLKIIQLIRIHAHTHIRTDLTQLSEQEFETVMPIGQKFDIK